MMGDLSPNLLLHETVLVGVQHPLQNHLDFAEYFSKIVAKLLNKKIVKPRIVNNGYLKVTYYSKAFYDWFKQQTLETLETYVEHDKNTVAYFLRGLYDSDGGHYVYNSNHQIRLYNNNLKLLKYVQYLLKKYFGIVATGPYIHSKAGSRHPKGERENRERRQLSNNFLQNTIHREIPY